MDRIESLEGRVNEMEQKIAVIEVNVDTSSKLQNMFSNALKEFGKVLVSIQITMAEMNTELKVRNETQQGMKDDIFDLNESLKDVNEKTKAIDDKGKLDLLLILKEKVAPWLMLAGIIYFIVKIIP